MIRFADVAPEPKPKKAAAPPVAEPVAPASVDTPKPAKAPRKPKASAR